MCVIEERTYVASDGTRQVVEVPRFCKYSHNGRGCSKTTRRKTEYYADPPSLGSLHDDAPSPVSMGPSTPNASGTVILQECYPSDSRPSSKHSDRGSSRYIEPKIIIDFGKKREKKYKRSSLGNVSISSNEVNIDTPGSATSYSPIRTGFPEAPPPVSHPPVSHGYTNAYNRDLPIRPSHHRHTSSSSSHASSTHDPGTYEPASPTRRRSTRTARPVSIHNSLPPLNSSVAATSPITTREPQSATYRTHTVEPRHVNWPTNYTEFINADNRAEDRAPEILDRDSDRERRRRQQAEDLRKKDEAQRRQDARRRQEEADRIMAEKLAAEEARQAKLETGRAQGRAEWRAESAYVEKERDRFLDKEEQRRKKEEAARMEKERQDRARAAKRREEKDRLAEEVARRKKQAEEARPKTTRDKSSKHTKKLSEGLEQQRQYELMQTQAQMAREREAAEQREREDRAAELRRQQQTAEYYDPRGGNMARRNSVSSRRNSLTSSVPFAGIGRRVSVHQPSPPAIDTNVPSTHNPYTTRPSSSHHRTSSYYDNPPPTSATRPASGYYDAAPVSTTRARPTDTSSSLRQRGEQVIAAEQARQEAEDRARQATRGLYHATQENAVTVGSEDDADRIAGLGPGLGLGRRESKRGKRRH